jgi:energy-coupling factor transport system ATP-binding protein
MQPNILIIDEPDTGLDARTTYDMTRTIKELNKKGKTIILISHNMELIAKHCTRLIAMKNGTIVSPQEIYEEYLNSAKAEPNA